MVQCNNEARRIWPVGFRGFFGAPAPGALLPLVGPGRLAFTVLFFLSLVPYENVVVVVVVTQWSGQTGKGLGPVNKPGTPVLRKARDEIVRCSLGLLVLKSIPVTKAKKKKTNIKTPTTTHFLFSSFVRKALQTKSNPKSPSSQFWSPGALSRFALRWPRHVFPFSQIIWHDGRALE